MSLKNKIYEKHINVASAGIKLEIELVLFFIFCLTYLPEFKGIDTPDERKDLYLENITTVDRHN